MADFGQYMKDVPAVHMDFEDNLPHNKLEIANAIWEVLNDSYTSTENNSEDFRNTMYFAYVQLLKCYPSPEDYKNAIEYQGQVGFKSSS